MARRLLLISTSSVFGTGYLEHAYSDLREVLRGVGRVLFIPHALKEHAGYAAKARAAFEEIGFGLDSLHEAADPRQAVLDAEAVFCGGGNTFRLLDWLIRLDVLDAIRIRALEGMPYTGASAGSNTGDKLRSSIMLRLRLLHPLVRPPRRYCDGLSLRRIGESELRCRAERHPFSTRRLHQRDAERQVII